MAILLGVVLGGLIVDAYSVHTGFYIVAGLYLAASIITFFIKKVPPEQELTDPGFIAVIKNFFHAVKTLLLNKDSKISMLGTSVFWGVGSMLRGFLFAWIPYMFLINDTSTPSNLMGALSIGIVIGAVIASKYFTVDNAKKSLIFGVLLGSLIAVLSFITNIYFAASIMVLLGIAGGLLVIPLNSLLQYRGHQLIGAGNSLAVQNFFENIFMLIAVGLFNLAIIYGVQLDLFLLTSGVVLASFFMFLLRSETKTPNV